MNAEEERLRERARLIDESYAFWDEKVCDTLHRIDIMESSYETPEEFYQYDKTEEELRYLLARANFEKGEMDKLERDIGNFVRRNEEKRKE